MWKPSFWVQSYTATRGNMLQKTSKDFAEMVLAVLLDLTPKWECQVKSSDPLLLLNPILLLSSCSRLFKMECARLVDAFTESSDVR